jgi:hypothetical protein
MAKKNKTLRNSNNMTIVPGPVRDFLVVALICGATKGGVRTDQKKEKDRRACRGKVQVED